MQLDIESNRIVLDSALNENNKMIGSYDTIVNLLESNLQLLTGQHLQGNLGLCGFADSLTAMKHLSK